MSGNSTDVRSIVTPAKAGVQGDKHLDSRPHPEPRASPSRRAFGPPQDEARESKGRGNDGLGLRQVVGG